MERKRLGWGLFVRMMRACTCMRDDSEEKELRRQLKLNRGSGSECSGLLM